MSYGPDTLFYYNAVVHKQYPTPADVNQAYAAAPPAGQHPLEAGLVDPNNHYLVNTTSFERPAGPVLLGMLHLQADNVQDLVVEVDGFTCSVHLDPDDRRRWSPVRVAFAQVWQVLRSDSPQIDMEEIEEAGGLLYDAPEVLSAYARQGRIA